MLANILFTVIFILICKLCWSLWNSLTYFKTHGIPYVLPLPVIGNLGPTFFNRIHIGHLLKSLCDRFPEARYVGFYDCMTPAILVRDPQLVKSLTITNFEHFHDNFGFTTEVEPLYYNSLFSLKGQRWRTMRNLLSPSFTSNKLKLFFNNFSKCAQQYIATVTPNSNEKSKTVQLKEFTSKFTNDTISMFVLGIDVNSLVNPEIYKVASRTFNFRGLLSLRFFLIKNFHAIARIFRITLFHQVDTQFYEGLVKDIVESRKANGMEYNDVLQTLIKSMDDPEAKVEMKLSDIQSQIFILFFGGFDTTSTYLSFVLYLLAREPDVQQKLQSEIDEVMKAANGKPSFEDVNQMKYLNAVISEAGRVYSPVPFVAKRCTKRFELPPAMPGLKPFVVEPGANVTVPFFPFHEDENVFPEPEKFDPERFLNNKVPTENYLAFGLGPRMCIGMRLAMVQMKVMVFHLLAQCSLKVASKDGDLEFVNTCWILMLKNGFRVEVEKRIM